MHDKLDRKTDVEQFNMAALGRFQQTSLHRISKLQKSTNNLKESAAEGTSRSIQCLGI